MRPPYGDHAACPVSSKRTTRTFGALSGALAGRNASQSSFESRRLTLTVPLNSLVMPAPLSRDVRSAHGTYRSGAVRCGVNRRLDADAVGEAAPSHELERLHV